MEPPSSWTPGSLLLWLRRSLGLLGVRPSRRLGQSFLYHPRGFELFSSNMEGGVWLEIGPGPGLLTMAVSDNVDGIVGIELDSRLVCLAAAIAPGNVSIARGDGLQLLQVWRGDSVYSNTPYHLSSAIIALAVRNNNVERVVLGVQKEVAYRILADPGTPDYGRLTLLVRRYFHARIAGVIPKRWFYPKPEVDGAVVVLSRKRRWQSGDEEFEKLTACLFTGRNRMAAKIAQKCACIDSRLAKSRFGDRRVRELDVGDVEWLLENGACTSGEDYD